MMKYPVFIFAVICALGLTGQRAYRCDTPFLNIIIVATIEYCRCRDY